MLIWVVSWMPWLNLSIWRVGSQLWKEKIHQLFLFKCFPTPPSFIYHFCQGSYQYFSLWNWMMKIPFKVTYAKVISSMCGETTQPNMAKRLDLWHCKNKISFFGGFWKIFFGGWLPWTIKNFKGMFSFYNWPR